MPLVIHVKEAELFNQANGSFYYTKPCTLILEHSLVSISKWESKWHKMYLETPKKTTEELIDYIRCMTITQNVDPMVYQALTPQNVKAVEAYIADPASASKFYENELAELEKKKKGGKKEIMTSEKLYALMTQYRINWAAEKWHLNRLVALIEYCGQMNQPPRKLDDQERLAIQRANKARYSGKGTHSHVSKPKMPTMPKR